MLLRRLLRCPAAAAVVDIATDTRGCVLFVRHKQRPWNLCCYHCFQNIVATQQHRSPVVPQSSSCCNLHLKNRFPTIRSLAGWTRLRPSPVQGMISSVSCERNAELKMIRSTLSSVALTAYPRAPPLHLYVYMYWWSGAAKAQVHALAGLSNWIVRRTLQPLYSRCCTAVAAAVVSTRAGTLDPASRNATSQGTTERHCHFAMPVRPLSSLSVSSPASSHQCACVRASELEQIAAAMTVTIAQSGCPWLTNALQRSSLIGAVS